MSITSSLVSLALAFTSGFSLFKSFCMQTFTLLFSSQPRVRPNRASFLRHSFLFSGIREKRMREMLLFRVLTSSLLIKLFFSYRVLLVLYSSIGSRGPLRGFTRLRQGYVKGSAYRSRLGRCRSGCFVVNSQSERMPLLPG